MTLQHHPIIEEDLQYIISQFASWEAFRNKTVFVTGANGFLPAYMIFTLLKANELFGLNLHVMGLVRNSEKANKKFGFLIGKNFSLVIQDVTQPVRTDRKIDFIIHAASQASPRYYGVDPVGTLNANVLGTNNLLVLAKEHSVESFLFFSTSEVYGQVQDEFIPTKEHQYGYLDITNVRSCYAESKRLGETMCVSWLMQHQVPAKMVRPFHTYGPGMALDDGRVYADFVASIVLGKDIVIKSDGSARRAFCYLADATAGFLAVLVNGRNGEAYNVGNSTAEISIYELARLVLELFPERDLRIIRDFNESQGYLRSAVSRICPDCTKLHGLGWQPRYSLKEGFSRTIESYK